MECKTTSRASARAAGFTLVEFLVAVALAIVIAGVLMAFSLYSSRTLLAAGNRMDLEAQARTALDRITKEMRSTIELKECKTNSITFTDFNKKQTKFEYDSKKRELVWNREGKNDLVLLRECDNVTFSLFDRAPASGTFELSPVTDPTLCKAVNISMHCSRTFVAPKIQSMNTLTATVVLRMK